MNNFLKRLAGETQRSDTSTIRVFIATQNLLYHTSRSCGLKLSKPCVCLWYFSNVWPTYVVVCSVLLCRGCVGVCMFELMAWCPWVVYVVSILSYKHDIFYNFVSIFLMTHLPSPMPACKSHSACTLRHPHTRACSLLRWLHFWFLKTVAAALPMAATTCLQTGASK